MSRQKSNLIELKKRVAIANRVMGYWYNIIGLGHIMMHVGHVSARIPGQNFFLVKGRPPRGDLMIKTSVSNVVTVNLEGKKVGGAPDVSMPGEIELHTYLYKARPDVGGICHAHPNFSVLSSVLYIPLKPICSGGFDIFPVAVYNDNAPISTDYHGQSLVDEMNKANACILRGHGAVTVANSPEKAMLNMMQLEEQAKMNIFAHMTVGENYPSISEEQLKECRDSVHGILTERLKGGRVTQKLNRIEQNLWDYLVGQVESIK